MAMETSAILGIATTMKLAYMPDMVELSNSFEMKNIPLLTSKEIEAVRNSWELLTISGHGPAGQLFLMQMFNDLPATRNFFKHTGLPLRGRITVNDIRDRPELRSHSQRMASMITEMVRNLENTDRLVELCTRLGKAHASCHVSPHHFNAFGPAFINLITTKLQGKIYYPTIRAWIKIYIAVADIATSAL